MEFIDYVIAVTLSVIGWLIWKLFNFIKQLVQIHRAHGWDKYMTDIDESDYQAQPTKPKRKKAKYKTMEDYGEIANVGDVSFTAKLQVREKTEAEEHIRQLHLKATEIKKDDINTSIDCLQEAQLLLDEVDTQYPISTYLRLPLFLQQADRMDEAEIIFKQLLDSRNDKWDKATIEDKWTLAEKREAKKSGKA